MEPKWNLNYFKRRGIDEKYLDAMALQYCELQKKCQLLLLFPSIGSVNNEIHNEAYKIIKQHVDIVYEKEIFMTSEGGFQLIVMAYMHEPFAMKSKHNGYNSVRGKASLCFPKNLLSEVPLKVILVESDHLDKVKACKQEIRNLYNLGHNSIHATDTQEEAVFLARSLFNKNSVHLLNNRQSNQTPNFDSYLEIYSDWLKTNGMESEWFCIDSGAVLAAYGLRDCKDLDFIHHSNGKISTGIRGLEDHNGYAHYYEKSIDEIVFDPDYHFYFRGVKFCSLPQVRKMKERRGESKDLQDVLLMKRF